jgi:diacylglycerol kinase family enzyme
MTMDERNFMALVSKKAGKFRPHVCSQLSRMFAHAGVTLHFHYVEDAASLNAEVERAVKTGCRSFLAVGGDGTVSMAASALYGKPHRLGIIPAGTANTVARILRIPISTRRAIKLALESAKSRPIDGLEVSGRLCLLNVSVGLSSLSIDELEPQHKARAGMLSYIFGIARVSRKIAPHDFQITIDGKMVPIRAVEIHVTNTGILGLPQYHIHEKSRIDDGRAEVLGLRQWTPQKVADALLDVALRRRNKRAIHFIGEGAAIRIESSHKLSVQADGDIIGEVPVEVVVRRQAINFIVP